MRMILIIVVVLLVLGGGGAGAYFYFMKPAEAATGPQDTAETAKAAEHGGAEGHEGAAASEFLEISPLVLPIVDGTGISQTISLVIALELPDVTAKDKAKEVMPRLTDAYIQEMYGVLSKQAAMKGGVVQVGYIKEKLKKVTTAVLGEDQYKDLFLQVVEQRPM